MLTRRSISISACLAVLLVSPSRANAQPTDPPRNSSLGAGVGLSSPGPIGAPFWLGTLSFEHRFAEPFAVIVSAGGSHQRTSTSSDLTKVTFARAGTGIRAFVTERADVEPSVFLVGLGQYTFLDDAYGGVVAELGGSVDASLSPNVALRVGANVAHVGFFTGEHMSDTTVLGFGIGPHAELRVKW